MKRNLIAALLLFICASSFAGDKNYTISAGFLFQNTLNATLGIEKELNYGNAIEVFAEAGNRWKKDPVCGKVCKDSFWKKYYWDGGVLYKPRLKKGKNSSMRLRIGPLAGASTGDYFFGIEGGFEWNYLFRSGVQFSIIQKNNVNFIHGDHFRNGLLMGLKIPF